MLLIFIFLLAVGSIFLIVYSIIKSKEELHLKLTRNHLAPGAALKPNFQNIRQLRSFNVLLKYISIISGPLSKLPYFVNLRTQAEILKINIELPVLFLFKIAIAVITATLASFLFSPAYVLIGAVVGFFLPDFYAWNKVKAKKDAIVRIFPETIDLLDMCINAGADFLSAIKWVVEKSSPNPFIEQLSIVLGEIQVGKSRSEALKDMARRLNLSDISSFVRTIIQSERMGTSIEESFKNLSEDTRGKRFQSGERYAIKASLKILFPLLFCILPAILIVVAGPIIIKFTSGELTPKF